MLNESIHIERTWTRELRNAIKFWNVQYHRLFLSRGVYKLCAAHNEKESSE